MKKGFTKFFTILTALLFLGIGQVCGADELVVIGSQSSGALTIATNTHAVAGISGGTNSGTIADADDGQTASGGSKMGGTSEIGSKLSTKNKQHIRFDVAAGETVRFYYYQTGGSNKASTFATSDFSQSAAYYHAATEYTAAAKKTLYYIDFVFADAGTYAISLTTGQTVYMVALKFTASGGGSSSGDYTATFTSAKGTAPETASDVASVTLSQITGVDGFTHVGWTADKVVTVDDASVSVGTLIANGKTAVLGENTAFTAVWKTNITPALAYDNSLLILTKITSATPTLTGNTGSGAVTWTSSAEGVATVDENGNVTAVAAGSTTIKAAIAANGDYAAGEATANIKVVAAPEGMIDQKLATGSVAWDASVIVTNDYTNVSGLAALSQHGSAIASGNGNTSNGGQTSKIATATGDFNDANYLELSFTVASGKVFNITSVVIPVQPVSSSTNNFKAVLSDNQGSADIIGTNTNLASGKLNNIEFASYGALKSTITLRIYAWGWGDGYRLGKNIVIDGTIDDEGACLTPTISWNGDQPANAFVSDGSKVFKINSNYPAGVVLELSNNTCGATIAAVAGKDNKEWEVSFTGAGEVTVTPKVIGDGSTVCSETVTGTAQTLTVTTAFDVTFNLNGHGAAIAKQTVAAGGKVTKPADPFEIGWDFGGWYTDAECTAGNEWDFANDVVNAATPLYAKWTAFSGCAQLVPATSGDALTVGAMVDLQAGSVGGSIKVANLGAEGSIAYNANGLSFSNGGKDSVLVTLNNDLKNGSIIKVRLMANGGTKDSGRGLNLYNAARVKKALLGWQANEEVTSGDIREFTYTVVESDGFAGTNVFTLQRQNSVFLQSIKVEECGDAVVYHNLTSEVNIAGKGTVTLGASSVREGYTTTATYSEIDPLYEFVNWTVSGAGASIADASANPATITMGTEDAVVTLNLQVKPVYYTVTYYDGTSEMGTEQVAENGHPTATGITTKKLGYNFLGWSETDGGAVVELNNISITAAKNLYAKYEAIVCPTSGTVYKFQLKTDLTNGNLTTSVPQDVVMTTENYLSALVGGTLMGAARANVNRIKIVNGSAIGFSNGDDAFLKMELDCNLQAGDIIKYTIASANMELMAGSETESTNKMTLDRTKTEVEVDSKLVGASSLYMKRTGSSPNISYFEIYRCPVVTGVTLSDLTVREGASTIPAMTLSPSDDARVTSQAWSILSGEDKITINTTTGEVTGVAQGDAEIKVVLNGDPAISATATVHVVESFVQQDVDEPIVWDFSKAGVVSSAFSEQVLANVDGVTLDASQFEATKLVGTAQNISATYFQGTMLTFNTTKAGLISVRFTNGNSNVRALKVYVGDPEVEIASWSYSNAAVEHKFIEVPAGKVTLRSYQESNPNNVRILNLEFYALGHSRDVTPGNLGTLCLPNACIARGVDVYELVGKEATYGKIVFADLEPDELLVAGQAYIFQVNEATARFYYAPGEPVDAPLNNTALKGNLGSTITFQPNSTEAENVYFVKDHALWSAKETGVNIGQYRAYLQMDAVSNVANPSPAPGRRYIMLGTNGTNVATGIDDVQDDVRSTKMLIDGRLFILRGEKIYDATGRLVK